MKRFKKLLSLVLAVGMMCAVGTTAWANESTEAPESVDVAAYEAVEVPAYAFDKANSRFLGKVSYLTDKDGNFFPVEGNMRSNTGSSSTEYLETVFYFYESSGTYCVSMTSDTVMDGWWFTRHTMKIKPKNNTSWMSHNIPYETQPTSISDVMCFTYPNGTPDNVTVQVKGSTYISSVDFLDKIWSYPDYTLDSP